MATAEKTKETAPATTGGNGGSTPTTRSKPIMDSLRNILSAGNVKTQFENALQENAGPFIASIMDLVGADKGLQDCSPQAVCMEALKAATLKLPINKQLGFAYIVGFKGVATFVLGYKGMIQLALRTGQYRFLNADFVYEGEQVNENRLTGEMRIIGEKKSETVIGYFAHMELTSGFTKTVWINKDGVVSHAKAKCPSWKNQKSAWHTDFDAMALKTCLRRLLSKWGIMTTEMQNALSYDDEEDAAAVQREIVLNANKGDVIGIEHEEAPTATQETAEAEQPEIMIQCPDGGEKKKSHCDKKCTVREGCPAHEQPEKAKSKAGF
jgi:recombination protein RecT